MPKKTKTEIKTAIKNVLNKVTIGSEGGSINGSIVITGENNFIKAPAFKIGDTDLSTFIEEAGKVKTVNNQEPDSTGNISIPIDVTVNGVTTDENQSITLTPADIGASASDHTHAYLPLAGGTMSGELNIATESGTQIHLGHGGVGVMLRNDGSDFYFLITATGDPWGQWNGLRPFRINLSSGAVFIGHDCTVGGAVFGAVFRATSDKRLKEDIKPVNYDLSSLSPYHYRLKTDNEYHVGLLAQEVEKIIPEAVSENKDGYKSLDYNAVVAVLVGQVNALTKRIEELEKR